MNYNIDKILIDTNILVYSAVTISEFCIPARALIGKYLMADTQLFITWQIIREFAVTMTSKELKTIHETFENIELFSQQMTILPETNDTFSNWKELIIRYDVKGKNIHDGNIIAVMNSNKINNILTHNIKDFQRYSKIINIIPLIA